MQMMQAHAASKNPCQALGEAGSASSKTPVPGFGGAELGPRGPRAPAREVVFGATWKGCAKGKEDM